MDEILDLPETSNEELSHYAGFWIRTGSLFIDMIIEFVGLIILNMLFSSAGANSNSEIVSIFILFILYPTLAESSNWQATFGKLIMGIKVINEKGERLTFISSLTRQLAKIVSVVPVFFGFIWAGFDERKQALHDKVVRTFVIHEE